MAWDRLVFHHFTQSILSRKLTARYLHHRPLSLIYWSHLSGLTSFTSSLSLPNPSPSQPRPSILFLSFPFSLFPPKGLDLSDVWIKDVSFSLPVVISIPCIDCTFQRFSSAGLPRWEVPSCRFRDIPNPATETRQKNTSHERRTIYSNLLTFTCRRLFLCHVRTCYAFLLFPIFISICWATIG